MFQVEQNFLRTKSDLDSIRNNKVKSGELDPIPDDSWGSSKATDEETRAVYRDTGEKFTIHCVSSHVHVYVTVY